jgi:cobyrinic acid a,c-diamide synthase
VALVVDASAVSQSVAALVHGYATLAGGAGRIAGIILNRVASDGHEQLLRDALAPLELPVFGVLRRDDALTWRDRHLGLVPVAEHAPDVRAALDRLAVAIERGCDLDGLARLAGTAAVRSVAAPAAARPVGRARLAVAAGPAFTFTYRDNIEALEQAGAEIVPFDPRHGPRLPEAVDGLVVGGGFPEVYGEALAANTALLADVRRQVTAGLPTWAECGGLLWLTRRLDGRPMAGVVAADATMTPRLALGYRVATVARDTPVAPARAVLRGHEFHYSRTDPPGDALRLEARFGTGHEGHATPALLATYLHLHLGAHPAPAERFVALAAAARTHGRLSNHPNRAPT